MHASNKGRILPGLTALVALSLAHLGLPQARAQDPSEKSSYDQIAPVLQGKESFQDRMNKDKADKPAVMARQQALLDSRYNLAPKPDARAKMSRGKALQVGPAAKL